MKLTLEISETDLKALARVHYSESQGLGHDPRDVDRRDAIQARILFHAAEGGFTHKEIGAAILADRKNFWNKIRRIPKSHRSGPGGRA